MHSTSYPQVIQEWLKTYSGYNAATASASTVDQYGNVYITGAGTSSIPLSGDDYYTIKYNSDGVLQWEVTYDGEIGNHDWGYCIAVDPLGNVYVTGESKGIINGWDSGSDILTIKYNPQGNELWTQRFHGNSSFTTYNYDTPTAIAVDEQGNVYVTGQSIPTGNTTGFGSCITIKYNTNGELLWTSRIGSDQGGYGQDIKADSDGNVYVLALAPGSFPLPDIVTVKYNSSGEQLWIKRYNVPGILPRAMETDLLGNVYVTAGDISPGIHTTKYNSAGDSLWTVVYAAADPADIAVDAAGNVFVTGRAVNAGYTGQEYVTIKYNSSGLEQWAVRYVGLGDDRFVSKSQAISLDSEGNIYVTGQSQGANFLQGDMLDFATVKYNTDGVEQWAVRYHRPPDGAEIGIGVHTSDDGAVYVVGYGNYMTSSNTPARIITIKYSQSPSDVQEINSEIPNSYSLQQNYPNPFNPTTKIGYVIPNGVRNLVTLKVYDVLGNEIATLVNEEKSAGRYEVNFDASRFASGIYFYKLQAGNPSTGSGQGFVETKKMILLR